MRLIRIDCHNNSFKMAEFGNISFIEKSEDIGNINVPSLVSLDNPVNSVSMMSKSKKLTNYTAAVKIQRAWRRYIVRNPSLRLINFNNNKID